MCGESMRSESMCSACSAKFLDPATRDPALYPKNYDAIRQIHYRDPKHRGSPDPLRSGYSNRHALASCDEFHGPGRQNHLGPFPGERTGVLALKQTLAQEHVLGWASSYSWGLSWKSIRSW